MPNFDELFGLLLPCSNHIGFHLGLYIRCKGLVLITIVDQRGNMGHASMVADLYAEDAITMWGDEPMRQGRAEITASLEAQMADGSPQVELHDVWVEDLGDGWHVGLGWYGNTRGGGSAVGGPYMVLTSMADDGSTVIHWDASHAAW